MPLCVVGKYTNEPGSHGVHIHYERYGHGSTKLLLIIGLAGTYDSWGPQVKGLAGETEPVDGEAAADAAPDGDCDGIEVCCFDNRGVGRSSVPEKKSDYTTAIMARDALALMDHLGWQKAHIAGHSMGSMIAAKLAAMAPERVLSLALLNTTGGGFQCIPKIERKTFSLAYRFLKARTPAERALLDLECHYTKEYLDERIGYCTRRDVLYKEYVRALTSTGMQSRHGVEGQLNACWTHQLTQADLDRIRSAGILVLIIHGRDDVVAQVEHARKLVQKLGPVARMVELPGGHLVSHERPNEVNLSLLELIKASDAELAPAEWSGLDTSPEGAVVSKEMVAKRSDEMASYVMLAYGVLGKLQHLMIYFFGSFMVLLECAKKIISVVKPMRVAAAAGS